jgi:two-component system, sensor histidine kinase PdtaS
VIIGLIILLTTVLASWLIGRQFAAELTGVAHATTAFRSGDTSIGSSSPSRISELAELKVTLENAMSERMRYENQLKSLIADKDLLMQEVHHRVKNSLQLVRGILSLQARNVVHPEVKSALNDAATRILTVADVHQHLYQGLSTAEVNVQQYLSDLADDLTKSLLDNAADRRVVVTAPACIWPSEKIIALGLIVTELATNAIKYGQGAVSISLTVADDQSAVLIVEDGGKGFDAGFEMGTGGGLGSKLIANLIRPDEGSISIDRSVAHGRVLVILNPAWRRTTRI